MFESDEFKSLGIRVSMDWWGKDMNYSGLRSKTEKGNSTYSLSMFASGEEENNNMVCITSELEGMSFILLW